MRLIGTHQDISERKLAEEILQASEEKFHTIFMMAPYSVALNRLSTSLLDVTRATPAYLVHPRRCAWKTSGEINGWVDPRAGALF